MRRRSRRYSPATAFFSSSASTLILLAVVEDCLFRDEFFEAFISLSSVWDAWLLLLLCMVHTYLLE